MRGRAEGRLRLSGGKGCATILLWIFFSFIFFAPYFRLIFWWICCMIAKRSNGMDGWIPGI